MTPAATIVIPCCIFASVLRGTLATWATLGGPLNPDTWDVNSRMTSTSTCPKQRRISDRFLVIGHAGGDPVNHCENTIEVSFCFSCLLISQLECLALLSVNRIRFGARLKCDRDRPEPFLGQRHLPLARCRSQFPRERCAKVSRKLCKPSLPLSKRFWRL